ncbi:MAG TPA: hypothetical protein VEL28_12695 [Candidatus Binatia bacterium]|nr:hypothetical protein [Candidatus Binatia bacterium]
MACMVCDTPTGEAVRAGVFDGSFVLTAMATLSPLPVIAAIAAAIHFGWPPGGTRAADDEHA